MSCPCDTCPKRGTAKCEKERLKFDVRYFRELLAKAEGKAAAEFRPAKV